VPIRCEYTTYITQIQNDKARLVISAHLLVGSRSWGLCSMPMYIFFQFRSLDRGRCSANAALRISFDLERSSFTSHVIVTRSVLIAACQRKSSLLFFLLLRLRSRSFTPIQLTSSWILWIREESVFRPFVVVLEPVDSRSRSSEWAMTIGDVYRAEVITLPLFSGRKESS